jgi:uncharacterized membrane protein
VLVTTLLVDRALLRIYSYSANPFELNTLFAAFILIVAISIVGQYVILGFARAKSGYLHSRGSHFKSSQLVVTLIQYCLAILLLVTIFQIGLLSGYATSILTIVTMTSYGFSALTLGILALRLFEWYNSKKSYVVLLYGCSSSTFVLSTLFLMTFFGLIVSNFPDEIQLHQHNLPYFNNPGSPTYLTYNSYVVLSILSFVILWAATVIVLRNYSKSIGKIKYWILVCLPLLYFMSQFVTFFFDLFSYFLGENPAYYGILLSLIFSISKSVGGILFGLGFWTMAMTLKKPNALSDFLTITAIGFILLFVSDQALSLISVPYPPFGLSSVAVVGIASYLILIGLYYSAVSVSTNIDLRKFISSSAKRDYNLLRSIGSAQMEGHIDKIVTNLVRENPEILKKENPGPSIEDMKDYTREIIEEIRRHKSGAKNQN